MGVENALKVFNAGQTAAPETASLGEALAASPELAEKLRAYEAGFRAGVLAAVQAIDRPAATPSAAIDAEGVGELLGISAKSVKRLHDNGKLPPPLEIEVGAAKWSRNVILDWIDAGCPDRQAWKSQEEVRLDPTPRRRRRTRY